MPLGGWWIHTWQGLASKETSGARPWESPLKQLPARSQRRSWLPCGGQQCQSRADWLGPCRNMPRAARSGPLRNKANTEPVGAIFPLQYFFVLLANFRRSHVFRRSYLFEFLVFPSQFNMIIRRTTFESRGAAQSMGETCRNFRAWSAQSLRLSATSPWGCSEPETSRSFLERCAQNVLRA